MKSLINLAFILTLLNPLYLYAESHPPYLSPPDNRIIVSDYGPRNVSSGSWFHMGIDYRGSYGDSIHSVEDGILDQIVYGKGGWYITIYGASGYWDYMHLFYDGPTPLYLEDLSGGNLGLKWELRNATLVKPSDSSEEQQYVIIKWVNEYAERIYSPQNGRWVKDSDDEIIKNSSGLEITTENVLTTDDTFGAVGQSGTRDTHLHLQCSSSPSVSPRGDINPLYSVTHPDSALTATIESPASDHIFTSEELNSDYPIKVLVNSVGSLDLDEVELLIYKNKDSSDMIRVGDIIPTFGYGGQPGKSKTSTIVESTDTATGIQPVGDIPGTDRFIYFQNFDSLNLPSGEHALVVKLKDVNGNESQEFKNYFTIHNYPTVESTSPENQSYNVATDSKITITFDSEMDTASVESAITISPDFSKTFSWSSDKKTVTITPSWSLSDRGEKKGTGYFYGI